MKVAVCDDEILVGQQICDLLKKILGDGFCYLYTNEDRIPSEFEENRDIDVVIMDIEWYGRESGIELAGKIIRFCPDIRIIFLTGYTEKYVQDIFFQPANLSGFLIKPVNEAILRKYLIKIQNDLEECQKERFAFRWKGETIALRYDEILYLESSGHRIFVFSKRGIYYYYDKLKKLTEIFPEDFVYCHKSFLVNMGEAHGIRQDNHTFEMVDGKNIPISKSRYNYTKKRFFEYMKAKAFSNQKDGSEGTADERRKK